MSIIKDFNLITSLWDNISQATVPQPLPKQRPKTCLVMEMPGFSVNPDTYNPEKFDAKKMIHPDRALAILADRVPALSPYFYDTGSHISFFWKQLLETHKLSLTPEDDPNLTANYKEAIKMLYGDDEGYIKQQKTGLFQNLEPLRTEWQKATEDEAKFWKTCQNENGWPENFQSHAGPYVERVDQAFTEYDNLKCQIEKYEAAIFQYTRGDLSRLLLEQAQGKSLTEIKSCTLAE